MNTLDQAAEKRLTAALVSRAGGHLRNPVRQPRVTCAVCTTPVDGYEYCLPCNRHRAYRGLADVTAYLTYAVAGQQSGYVMRGYKAQRPVNEHVAIVLMMMLLALSRHESCPRRPGRHASDSLVDGPVPPGQVRRASAASDHQPC